MSISDYDKAPFIFVPDNSQAGVEGWDGCVERLKAAIAARGVRKTVLTVECYPGVFTEAVRHELELRLAPGLCLNAEDALLPPAEVQTLVAPYLGGDDPVFGFLGGLTLPQFFEPTKLRQMRGQIEKAPAGLILIIGCGAELVWHGDLLVYADLPRREAHARFKSNTSSNLGSGQTTLSASLRYKRAFFVDWRVADRWKRPLIRKWDFLLDTTQPAAPKLVRGEAVRQGLREALRRPFRVVPFFDPAPWGGQWMRRVCQLGDDAPNYGWCFDCVPEENSLRLEFGSCQIEIPSLNLVFAHPRELLGEAVHARFGDEFPIRFDFLDTMRGGNLSFQVHPLTEYIQHHFGMHYTQDESYYLLDAEPDACVYLGLRENIDATAMVRELKAAEAGGQAFEADLYANRWPAKKHDHFLIPAGTVHCSGANSMVLEISATPYIFTFKMWDWARLGLDGKPRPIHLDHGVANIQWDRTTAWVKKNLINCVNPCGSGPGWQEEITGLHERQFIETRRHWFTSPVEHHTQGGVNVLNLVEGEAALVESPAGAFAPFEVHYAETFIVPATVGAYRIRPLSRNSTERYATVKAFVRPPALPRQH